MLALFILTVSILCVAWIVAIWKRWLTRKPEANSAAPVAKSLLVVLGGIAAVALGLFLAKKINKGPPK